MALLTGKVRTIENWGQLWQKWVTVIQRSKITYISWYPLSQDPILPPLWRSSSFAVLDSTDQPLIHCTSRLCFSNRLPENWEEKKLQKSCIPLEDCIFPCVWASWMQNSHQSSAGSRLWSAAAAREVQQRWQHLVVTLTGAWSSLGAAVPGKGQVGCLSPHPRPGVCLSWWLSCLSSAQPSYAVITPPDGTADILLEILNNSLLRPIFQALI